MDAEAALGQRPGLERAAELVARSRIPAIPRPEPSADGAVAPWPSSRTSSSSMPGSERTVTSARVAPAWRSVFVSASCTIR